MVEQVLFTPQPAKVTVANIGNDPSGCAGRIISVVIGLTGQLAIVNSGVIPGVTGVPATGSRLSRYAGESGA
jgi:hypothetical protein